MRMSISEDQLVSQYAPLVRRLALQLAARLPASIELDDLMQAGMMGLLDASRRFRETEQAQFETYAVTRIRGAMLDELRAQDWLPRSVRSKSREIERAVHELNQRLLRAPTEAEIARHMGLGLDAYQALLDDVQGVQIIHYEDLDRGGNGAELAEHAHLAGQPTQAPSNPLHQLVSKGVRDALIAAIATLPEREQLLVSLLFEQNLNQKEIGMVMGVTEGRVSQIRSQAVARIRAHLAENVWNEGVGQADLQTLL
jgi:RNA polymerase sigma factor for flagellar operon FliA